MKFAEFLVANQDWVAPLIEWGGLLLLLLITLSPFLIIRHRIFKPTRWWHIFSAYFFSLAIFMVVEYFLDKTYRLVVDGYLNSVDLYNAYGDVIFRYYLWLFFLLPISVFYSAKILYKKLSGRTLIISFGVAFILFTILTALAINFVAHGLGQASYNF